MKKNLSTFQQGSKSPRVSREAINSRPRGFTLIELLVVIAIIGLLSTLAVVALNSARQKARDAKRVADVKQIQTALELYFNDSNSYPGADHKTLGKGGGSCASSEDCVVLCYSDDGDDGSNDGFQASTGCGATSNTIYMGLVPAAPTPPDGDKYVYTGVDVDPAVCESGGICPRYQIQFTLEGKTGSLEAGANCATQDGVTSGACGI